ncbi:hypothetical protein D9758_011782 [Tetrapyrgos nigripes]|uniref:Rab proteins geranylgeranyltransferase component A n=1 Tax=Tetrapyrgos nigripes TaxID=182062 RepID=A0A8H5CXE7_9AGAR|nr:hypothetical protein D9758_011782 [Tetrapyrgos nigripes]
MDEGAFDVVVIGTGLTESIAAAALSKAGFKVGHLDQNPYYGGDEASLFLDEFVQWSKDGAQSSGCSSFSRSGETLPQSRQYSISLSPSIIPSTGPLISSLIASGVSRYGGFRLVDQFGIYNSSGTVRRVPGNKEDIFKNKNISLVDKRRLMRFLMFASGDFEDKNELKGNETTPYVDFLKRVFSLNDEIASTISYALSYCLSPADTTLPALQRLRRYLRSAGRYGSSPFLVGHYGSSGEIAQGFCRAAAVSGGVYILGQSISSIIPSPPSDTTPNPRNYTIRLKDFPDPLTCDIIISSQQYVPSELASHTKHVGTSVSSEAESVETTTVTSTNYTSIARCIAIIDRPLTFSASQDGQDDDSSETADDDEDAELDKDPTESQTTNSNPNPKLKPPTPVDAGVLVFPPSCLPNGLATEFSVTAFIVGDSTMSTPKEKWIIYLSTPISKDDTSSADPETILRPYLDATLRLASPDSSNPPSDAPKSIKPLFTTFYLQSCPLDASSASTSSSTNASTQTATSASTPTYLITPSLPLLPIPSSPDEAATNAERVFWEAVRTLKGSRMSRQSRHRRSRSMPGGVEVEVETEADTETETETETEREIESFWPPLEQPEEEDDS